MRKIGFLSVVVLAFIMFYCDSGEPMPAGSHNVELTMLATGANGIGVPSAGRFGAGWPAVNDSVIFTQAMLGVTKVELETLDSTDLHDYGDCGNEHSGDGDDDDDHSDSTDTGRIAHDGDGDYHHHDGDEDGDEIKIEGAFIVDLIAGTSTPDMGFDSLASGTIRELDITVGPILPDSNSVFLAFQVFHDSTSQMVEFSTSRIFEIEIEKNHGLPIEDNPLGRILVLLRLERLLSHINFSHLEADEDGVIRINDSSNMMLFALVKSRFNGSFEMGRDHDHDGDIDDD